MKIPSAKEIQNFIFKLPLISFLIRWSKHNSLPGFFHVPLFDVISFIFVELKQFNINMRANSMAFSFFLSLFPSILVIFTLIPFILPYFSGFIIPYIPEELLVFNTNGSINFNQTIIAQINELINEVKILPDNARQQLVNFINEVATQSRFDVLSLGFLLAIFFASNGMITMMQGFEKSHTATFVKRSIFKKRIIGFWITILLGTLVIGSLLLIILGNTLLSYLFEYLDTDSFTEFSIQLLRWIISFFLFYFAIALIYHFGIATKMKVKYFSPGATLATFLSIATSLIFAWYVNSFGAYNKLYGTIGTFIVIMLWIQINCFIILIGFELNAAIAVNRDLKKFIVKKNKKIEKNEI